MKLKECTKTYTAKHGFELEINRSRELSVPTGETICKYCGLYDNRPTTMKKAQKTIDKYVKERRKSMDKYLAESGELLKGGAK